MSVTEKNKQQTDNMVGRIADVSMQIRQAVRAAIPAPPEQFFTLMIPGKVLDFNRFIPGIDEKTGEPTSVLPPAAVQLEEAVLCDDMPAISAIQLGPTGRSVARSYASTLSLFCPAGSTTGVSDGTPKDTLSDAERRYQYSMTWLTSRDPNDTSGRTRVDAYREKQERYTAAFERKVIAYSEALKRATTENPTKTPKEQREIYDQWVAENYRTYNNLVQAAYMDWVTMGKKEEVEYYFSIIDNDSAMSRVETSKECMRNSVISTPDGAAEYHKVRLDPANWAWLAKEKSANGPVGETVDSLTFKIARLQKINFLLESMKDNKKFILTEDNASVDPEVDPEADPAEVSGQKEAASKFFEAQDAHRQASGKYETAVKEGKTGAELEECKTNLGKAGDELKAKKGDLARCLENIERKKVGALTRAAQKARKELFDNDCDQIKNQIKKNEGEISDLSAARDKLSRQNGLNPETSNAAQDLQVDVADKAGILRAPPSVKGGSTTIDPWTSVSIEVASSYSSDSKSTDALSFSADASIQYGLASAAISVSHNESHTKAVQQMANASVKISFECMRVDITRPWLRGELFYDHDLRIPEHKHVSPGPLKLIEVMDPSPNVNKSKLELYRERYDSFPMYPTAFLLAANIILEISGETSEIQSYLNNSSTSASARVSYGPFSASGGGARATGKSDSSCESTATGCRITIKSPQIIGWISQILPALPRKGKASDGA